MKSITNVLLCSIDVSLLAAQIINSNANTGHWNQSVWWYDCRVFYLPMMLAPKKV
ncbi:hypothetical protein L6232_02660 [Shewanella sp. C31]|nr:hypothetical protein [Shewanella electrica]